MVKPRGTGSLLKYKNSKNWYIQYYWRGQQFRESTGTRSKKIAEKKLAARMKEIVSGEFNPQANEITVAELVSAYLVDAKNNGLKSIDDIQCRWDKHLASVFARLKAAQVVPMTINRYIESRKAAGAPNSTINREIGVIQRAFNLAHEDGRIGSVPYFKHLEERNVRRGFLEFADAQHLRAECLVVGQWMLGVFQTGYTFGWRSSEVVRLTVGQIDLFYRCIRLYPEDTKNEEGRVAYMTELLYSALLPLVRGKSNGDPVFTRDDGSVVKDFRKAWWGCCRAAGLGTVTCRVCRTPSTSPSWCPSCHSENIGYTGLLFHDLRRTAIRDMVRRGVPEKVAMMISGHKTRSVFDRYHIVSDSDLREAARRMEMGVKSEAHALNSESSVRVSPETPVATVVTHKPIN
jgi:integrase